MSGAKPLPLTREEAKASCDAQVARTAQPLLLVTAILLAAFTIVTPFLIEWPAGLFIAVSELVLAGAFFGGSVLLNRPAGIRFVNPIFITLCIGALAASILSYVATANAVVTSGVVLLILSAGIIMLSWPWVVSILAIYSGGWLATLAIAGPPRAFVDSIFTIAAAVMLSAMAHAARIRTHLNLEALRRHEAGQRAELEQHVHDLRVTQGRLQRVISAAPVVVFVTDASGILRLLEGRSVREHGWDPAQLVGRPAVEVLESLPDEVARLQAALRGESTHGTTVIPSGTTFDTFWSTAYEADGSIGGAICVAIDVTARVKMVEEELRAAQRESDIQRLQEMDRFKTRILNTASHELNTPLTPIKLQMHLLKTNLSGLNEKQTKAIALLDRNVDRLAGLVSDIMDVARLQEGALRLALDDTALHDLVREAGASYEAVAQSKRIQLHVDVEEQVVVRGDPKRLMQILFNLLGNALKFTPEEGAVTLALRVERDHALVSVNDTGPGMDAEQIARLFRPFSQVHDTSRTGHGGTGLGLYISRGLAEQHGGTITCASDGPGRGTTFTLSLPLAR